MLPLLDDAVEPLRVARRLQVDTKTWALLLRIDRTTDLPVQTRHVDS